MGGSPQDQDTQAPAESRRPLDLLELSLDHKHRSAGQINTLHRTIDHQMTIHSLTKLALVSIHR